MTFGSLFAGIGGLDLGLERAGMVCKWQVEIDDYARRVLAKHWPNVQRWDDIKTFPSDTKHDGFNETAIRSSVAKSEEKRRVPQFEGYDNRWDVDLICAGFPCQDISYAGKGAGLDSERSGLFYEAVRVAGLLKPRYLLLENVAALLNRGMVDVLGTLASIGFDAEWHCLQAADFGAPHIRDRVFILAQASGGVLSDPPRTEREPGPSRRRIRQSDSADLAQWWSTEPDVGRVAYGIPSRVDRLRGLGNAVVPQIAEWLGRQIIESDSKTPADS